MALAMGLLLWLSAWDRWIARSQSLYLLALMPLLAFVAVVFLIFLLLVRKDGQGS